MASSRLKLVLILTALTAVLYLPVLEHGFTGLDDDLYVTENNQVRAGLTWESVRWALTSTDLGFWHPLTLISHLVDVELFGLHPAGHHLSAILLHLAGTALLFLAVHSMTGALWASALVAWLFAVHPLHVESVAWVAERKEVLAGFFWIVTMGAYARYVRRPAIGRFGSVMLFFACGLMAKPMVVTLPFVLLLLDYWPLGRFSLKTTPPRGGPTLARVVGEKVPLLALSLGMSLVAYQAESRVGAIMQGLPLATRGAYVPIAYLGYLRQTFWPRELTVYYPHPGSVPPAAFVLGATLVVLGLTVMVLLGLKRRPYASVGWLWFLGTLVPVIGLIQVGSHFMGDRYTYVPLIGLFIVFAWGLLDLCSSRPGWRGFAILLTLSASVLLFAMARIQIGYWRDDETLFRHAIDVTSGNWLAHGNLGATYLRQGRLSEGVAELEASLRIDPRQTRVRINLGKALEDSGRIEEAVDLYRRGLEQPGEPDPGLLKSLGVALGRLGRMGEATRYLEQAVEVGPETGDAHYNLGVALMREGRIEDAITHYRRAIVLDPNDAEARRNLELALTVQGKPAGPVPEPLPAHETGAGR